MGELGSDRGWPMGDMIGSKPGIPAGLHMILDSRLGQR